MRRTDDNRTSALERAGYVGAGAVGSIAAPLFANEIARQLVDGELKREPERTPDFYDALDRIRGHASVKANAPFPAIVSNSDTAYYPEGRDLLNEPHRARMPEASRGLIASDGRLAGLLHELGHATGRGGISKGRAQLITKLYGSTIPTALAAGVALPNRILSTPDEEVSEYERGLGAISALPTVLATPLLYEEARANIRGAGFARKFNYDVPSKRFILPWLSYAAAPLAASGAVYGIGRMALRKRQKDKEDSEMSQSALKKLAELKQEQEPWYKRVGPGALISGAVGLAGLGVGARKHIAAGGVKKQLLDASNALTSAASNLDRVKPMHADAVTATRAADSAYASELANILSSAGDNHSLREALLERLQDNPEFSQGFIEPATQARNKLRDLRNELTSAQTRYSDLSGVVNSRTKELNDTSFGRNVALGVGSTGVGGALLLGRSRDRQDEQPQPQMLGVRQ